MSARFSLRIAHFVPIHLQTWPPQTILVSDWQILKIFSSFGSFGQAVSEEKISKIGQSETRNACGGHVCKWIGTKCTIDWLISKKSSYLLKER
jgi:hypothetical protein